MDNCIFCKIAKGEIPSMKVYEDDKILAYLDINPDSDGHTLIIPKNHYQDIFDIPEELLNYIYKSSKEIMNTLKEKLNCDGFILQQNNGNIQEVKHYHLHIKPTYKNKESIKFSKNKEYINDVEEVYSKIKVD